MAQTSKAATIFAVTAFLAWSACTVGCSQGSGASTGAGGTAVSSGGSSGGASGSGTGGTQTVATGGAGSGGVTTTGGTSTTSTGGSTASGGASDKGGSSAGGASGGTSGVATGGSTGSGGSSGSTGADAAVDRPEVRDATPADGAEVRDAAPGDSVDVSDAPAADVPLDSGWVDGASIVGTNNPVLAGLFADPAVVLFDQTFYIYPTTDGFADWGATSFSVFSSSNLVEWTNRGVVLTVPTDTTWATGHAWAPSAARVGDTYYFYFTADNKIGVATAKSPTGPFKDALGKPLIADRQYGVVSIDPHVFIDDDGQAYLYFGNGGLRVGKLKADMVSFASTPVDINPSGTSGTIEGSAMFKRKGTYYLKWSEGDTRLATYRDAYARAQSPLGPFTRLAVILEQDTKLGILGPGGSTVLALPARDEHYIVYHRFKISGGDGTHRETCIDPLYFGSDGTIIPVKPTLQGLQIAVSP
jgi:hypothetical protein